MERKGSYMFEAPMILKETREGITAYRIEDDMLHNRQVCLMGPVTEGSVNSLVSQLLYLERKAPGEEITMFINSGGGQVGNGLALYDVMRQISSPVRTICMCHACSMAAVLFAAGDKREIYSHSKVMIHDPSISGRLTSKALELQALSEDLLATRQTIAEILSLHTGQTIKAILEKTCIDSYFNAEEAIEFGLADAVIENSK